MITVPLLLVGCAKLQSNSMIDEAKVAGTWTGSAKTISYGSGRMRLHLTEGGGYTSVLFSVDGMRYSEEGTWKLMGGGVALYKGSHLVNTLSMVEGQLVSNDGSIVLHR